MAPGSEARCGEVRSREGLLGAVASSYSVSGDSGEMLKIGGFTARRIDGAEGEDLSSVAATWQASLILEEVGSEMRRRGLSADWLARELGLGVAATKSLLEGRGRGVDLEIL